MKIAMLYSSATQKGIEKGLSNIGHTVVPMYYGYENPSLLDRLIYRGSALRLKKIAGNFNQQLKKLRQSKDEQGIDCLLILKGHFLSDENKSFLKNLKIPKIQWTIDSFDRFPGQRDVSTYMDKIFVQDGIDEENGLPAKWLPLGFDEEIFTYSDRKDIDVLLLGTVTQPFYKTRLEYIVEASGMAKAGYNVVFAGGNLPEAEKQTLAKNNVTIMNRLPLTDYAKLIARAKVCVNIHQDDGGKPINPIFFAIPATGGIQVTEEKEYLSRWLESKTLFFPEKRSCVQNRIREILDSNLAPLSKNISEAVTAAHSYTARAKDILA